MVGLPTTRIGHDGVVHVVASDGVRFCGPYHVTWWRESKPTNLHVTCLSCAWQWSVLKES